MAPLHPYQSLHTVVGFTTWKSSQYIFFEKMCVKIALTSWALGRQFSVMMLCRWGDNYKGTAHTSYQGALPWLAVKNKKHVIFSFITSYPINYLQRLLSIQMGWLPQSGSDDDVINVRQLVIPLIPVQWPRSVFHIQIASLICVFLLWEFLSIMAIYDTILPGTSNQRFVVCSFRHHPIQCSSFTLWRPSSLDCQNVCR